MQCPWPLYLGLPGSVAERRHRFNAEVHAADCLVFANRLNVLDFDGNTGEPAIRRAGDGDR